MVVQRSSFSGKWGALRPQKGAAKVDRQHPYRKMRGAAADCRPQPVVASAVSMNGSGHNGHATLPAGLSKHLVEAGTPEGGVDIYQLMEQVASGGVDPTSAALQVQDLQSGAPKADESVRASTWGESCMPDEIVWAPGKPAPRIAYALQRLAQRGYAPMAARVAPEVAREIQSILPDSRYNEVAGAVTLPPGGIKKPARLPGTVALVCDNSAEAGVAEEAKLACAAMGCYAYKLGGAISDGSSAGGIPPNLIAAQSADVVVVISDCSDDAALPSLISSSVSSPVVLVPLARLEGGPPPGVTAVDVGNGVAAAIFAARILKSSARLRPGSN